MLVISEVIDCRMPIVKFKEVQTLNRPNIFRRVSVVKIRVI